MSQISEIVDSHVKWATGIRVGPVETIHRKVIKKITNTIYEMDAENIFGHEEEKELGYAPSQLVEDLEGYVGALSGSWSVKHWMEMCMKIVQGQQPNWSGNLHFRYEYQPRGRANTEVKYAKTLNVKNSPDIESIISVTSVGSLLLNALLNLRDAVDLDEARVYEEDLMYNCEHPKVCNAFDKSEAVEPVVGDKVDLDAPEPYAIVCSSLNYVDKNMGVNDMDYFDRTVYEALVRRGRKVKFLPVARMPKCTTYFVREDGSVQAQNIKNRLKMVTSMSRFLRTKRGCHEVFDEQYDLVYGIMIVS